MSSIFNLNFYYPDLIGGISIADEIELSVKASADLLEGMLKEQILTIEGGRLPSQDDIRKHGRLMQMPDGVDIYVWRTMPILARHGTVLKKLAIPASVCLPGGDEVAWGMMGSAVSPGKATGEAG